MTNGVMKGHILSAQIRNKFNLKNNNCYIEGTQTHCSRSGEKGTSRGDV